MLKKIVMNGKECHFKASDLPCLIHGQNGVGASLFTVSLIADLHAQGNKILFLSGYPMARDELISQIGEDHKIILADNPKSEQELHNSDIIFVPRENARYFSQLASQLTDIHDRVILIKNIDLFSETEFIAVADYQKLIVSGNIDKCSYKDLILKSNFETNIFFSQPETDLGVSIPNLNKYHGYAIGVNNNGLVTVH